MSQELSNLCPIKNCPDNYGTQPACASLSVPYVPFQQTNSNKYDKTEALSQGTLFPGLNLPFHLKSDGSELQNTPLSELQALEFVVLELGTYLDTHPDDMEAFELFQEYVELSKEAKATYEKKYGPLTRQGSSSFSTYRWLQDPWPWNVTTSKEGK